MSEAEVQPVLGPHLHILTIFPDFFEGPLGVSILGKAIKEGQIEVTCHNIRDQANNRHCTVDDSPFGGGSGMIMMPAPIVSTLEDVDVRVGARAHRILLTPSGTPLRQAHLQRWSTLKNLAIICGRYEGIDARVGDHFVDEEISLGDFVLFGGETAALAIVEGITRLVPGIVGNAESIGDESFTGDLLEYPQYTRPREYRGFEVPDVLLGGNHALIHAWRVDQARARTQLFRPDLLSGDSPTSDTTDKNT